MSRARFVYDTLEQEGWSVEIADAQKVKGLAPLACKTDKIDSMVLAVLSHPELVPAIWLPDPRVRDERELARFRMHLVRHKSSLKNRIHSTLINFGRDVVFKEFVDSRFDVEESRGRGGRVLIFATHHARGRHSGVRVEQRFAYVFTVREDKVERLEVWADRGGALEAFGGD